ELASHRRGCDALISRDNGKTWNLDRRYELDRFDFLRTDDRWVDGKCGHIAAVALPDGHVLSAYGNYLLGGAVLIKWKPDAGPIKAVPKVGIQIGPKPGEVERYAADELASYLGKLFRIETRPAVERPESADVLLLVGTRDTNPAVAKALGKEAWPQVSDQGIVLKRATLDGKPTLIIGGGSDAATLWAVYELVERWGVRYLLHGDVLPQTPGTFRLPDADVALEPNLKVRQWRVVNDFACGPVSWGLDEYRRVLDQLAKLRFNRVFASIYPTQPFLDLEVKGIKREKANLWYGWHYPITYDMPGRWLFGKEPEFWNPDLPRDASYKALADAGERLVHGIFAHAQHRGMQCAISATLTSFPPEFAPLLNDPQKVRQLDSMGIVPGPKTDMDDPALTELAAAVLRATANTYPKADYVVLGMPEMRQWVDQYERAWRVLDQKYRLSEKAKLEDVVAAAGRRTGYPGGAERAVREVKGDIVSLYYFDHVINDVQAMRGTRRSDMRFIFGNIAEELFPVLSKLLPPGSETLAFVDYTASRILRRRAVLKNIPGPQTPATLHYTLHDDNVGVLPQLTTGSLHELTRDLRHHGWAGFSSRYWLIGDHDPCVAYLSRAAWHADATPEAVYRDQIRAACGEACVEDMLTVFREVEATTVELEWHGLGLTFPIPGMMMSHWKPNPMPAELKKVRPGYQRALAAARRAQGKASAAGRKYTDYWVGRLEFGIGYLDTIEAVRRAATAEAAKKPAEALQHAETALATARRALEAYARVAGDQSDRGAIATMAEYVYRPLKAKVAQLQK
ncbi:MAG: hypothetical protein FJ388_14250, partial [Verrucomicrobia bacterium]|nr:hypothetical protein [Verrucomicrobiota bacterium]